MIENKEVMAANIRRNMEEKGVNSTEVCRALGIKQNTFSDWINAKTYPRIDKIELMAAYFGVSKSDLVEGKHPFGGIILSADERLVVEVMRADTDFKNHLVKYTKAIKVAPHTHVVKKVAKVKRAGKLKA